MVRGFLNKSGTRAWLTGGSLRDLLAGRTPEDIDIVIAGPCEPVARAFADAIGGSFVVLSERFQACRVIDAGGVAPPDAGSPATFDFTTCRGDDIEADLGLRDFTVNAMALALSGNQPLIDPTGGRADLEAERLTAVSADIFRLDPLRLIRAIRLEKETHLRIEPRLEQLIQSQAILATNPAVERIFHELTLLLQAPGGAGAIRRLDQLGLLEVLLPQVHALQGVSQNDYHHLDVYNHVLASCDALDTMIVDPATVFPDQADWLWERSRRRIAGDADWRFVMSFAAITHDIAKPCCAFTDTGGQTRFFEHDRLGGDMVADLLNRLKAGSEVTHAVSFLVRNHMRFENISALKTVSDRTRLRYLKATAPFSSEAIMLAASDRLAVRGVLVTPAQIDRHLGLCREMMAAAFAADQAAPLPPLIDGDKLMRELALKPGPVVGRLLERIREEQELGHIDSTTEALAVAVAILEAEPASGTDLLREGDSLE
ncbi:MAG: tRNA nucleotidyltransferase/poly(A) polymerase family protein [Thermoleophilia bacterium]